MPLLPEDLRFGELAVAQGLCTPAQLAECVAHLERLIAGGASPTPRLGEILARKGFLTPAQLEATIKVRDSGTASSSGASLPPEARTAAEDPGAAVGKYVKVSMLGAGGMGEVWKGWDRELGRWVALKFLKHDDPQEALRFQREAQTAAGLSHPNIASVYEVGQSVGRPFLAMQLVGGRTLAAFPRNDVRKLVSLIRDAALAVQHAHERGVIHRDLKPHNLMVEDDRVFVMDFGLAKQATVDVSLSVSGAILGTPSYMAPEQARGESAKVGPASDVYALGATLYDLLADRPPFQAEEVYSLLKKVIEEEPVPLRKRTAKADADLETIVQKCLEKDPARRYGTARELADDLTRWLGGEAILAHPPSVGYRLRKYIRRHKGIAAAATLGLAAVVATLAILVPRLRSESARAEAEKETRRRSEKELKELGHLAGEVAVVREWVRQAFRRPEEIRAEMEKLLGRVTEFVRTHPELPQGRFIRARALLFLSRVGEAEKELLEAIRLAPDFAPARALVGQIHLERYSVAIYASTQTERAARQKASAVHLDEAEKAFAAAGSESASIERWGLASTRLDAVQAALARAMTAYYKDHRKDEAREMLRKAHAEAPSEEFARWLAEWSPSAEEERWLQEAVRIAPHYAPAYLMRGSRRVQDRAWEEGLRELTLALTLDPRLVLAYNNRAVALLSLNRLDEALKDADRAIEIDPEIAISWASRSAIRHRRGDLAGCISDADQALRLDPNLSFAYCNRGGARVTLEDPDGALPDLQKALELDPNLALTHCNLSAIYLLKGDGQTALTHSARAIELDPDLALGYCNRAGARLLLGEAKGVFEDCEQALKLDPREKYAYLNRCAAKLRLGDVAGSEADASRAIEIDPRFALAYVNRASGRILKGDLAGAAADLETVFAIHPSYPMALAARASLHLARGELELAEKDLARALDRDPRFMTAYLIRAYVRIAARDTDEALKDVSKAIELAPRIPEGYLTRGLVRLERGEWKEAVQDFDRAYPAMSGSAALLTNRAIAREALNDGPGALRDLTLALEADPRYGDAWLRRGMMLLNGEEYAKAIADFDQCLKLDPKQALAWANRGISRRFLKDPKGAVADCTQAIELDPGIPEAWLNRAYARHDLKDAKGAIADLRKALEIAPPDWPHRDSAKTALDALLKEECH